MNKIYCLARCQESLECVADLGGGGITVIKVGGINLMRDLIN